MMLLWADGFDHYGDDEAKLLDGAYIANPRGILSTVTARTGSRSLLLNANTGSAVTSISKSFGGALSVVGIGFGVYFVSIPSSLNFFTINDQSGTAIVSLTRNADGSISLRRGSFTGTLIATSSSNFTAAAWSHAELKMVTDPIVGSFEFRINGNVVLKQENLNLGANNAASIEFYSSGTNGYYIDDFFIWDNTGDYNNDFMGPVRVLTLFPDGNSTPDDWVPTGAATTYEAVDEAAPDDDTSYITGSTVDDESTFTLPALPPEIVSVKGVVMPIRAKLAAAGVGAVTPAIISGASRDDAHEINLTPAYTYWAAIFEEDPATLAPYTAAGFNAAVMSLKKTM